MQNRMKWDEETVAMYNQRFGVQAIELLKELQKHGFHDQDAILMANTINNIGGINETAKILGFYGGGHDPF